MLSHCSEGLLLDGRPIRCGKELDVDNIVVDLHRGSKRDESGSVRGEASLLATGHRSAQLDERTSAYGTRRHLAHTAAGWKQRTARFWFSSPMMMASISRPSTAT